MSAFREIWATMKDMWKTNPEAGTLSVLAVRHSYTLVVPTLSVVSESLSSSPKCIIITHSPLPLSRVWSGLVWSGLLRYNPPAVKYLGALFFALNGAATTVITIMSVYLPDQLHFSAFQSQAFSAILLLAGLPATWLFTVAAARFRYM